MRPGFRRGLCHLAGSALQLVGEIQNGLAAVRPLWRLSFLRPACGTAGIVYISY